MNATDAELAELRRRRPRRVFPWMIAGIGAAAVASAVWRARHTKFSFADKVVLITGGSRGLGLEIARQLGDEGARVAICARDNEEVRRAVACLEARGGRVLGGVCDVTNRKDVDSLIRRIEGAWGSVDVLFNNAGIIGVGPLAVMDEEDFAGTMDTHFWGALHMINAVLPGMRRRRRGRIVNIGSIGGQAPIPHLTPYCASKFALVGLSQSLYTELARDDIITTTICPGLMRTGSHVQAGFKGQNRVEFGLFTVLVSLPLLTMNAATAARHIVEATRHGRPHLTLSAPAKTFALVHALAPSLTLRLLRGVNRLLPHAVGRGGPPTKGMDSRSKLVPAILTTLSDRAAHRNNELPAARRRRYPEL